MSLTALQNLVKTGELKAEPFSKTEFESLMAAAVLTLMDAANKSVSYPGRFQLLYKACHALALAAMRRHGYRSNKRYLVFQCLKHTSTLGITEVRLLAMFHEKRNLAEYEGFLEPDEQFLEEVSVLAERLYIEMDPLIG